MNTNSFLILFALNSILLRLSESVFAAVVTGSCAALSFGMFLLFALNDES